MIMLGCAIALLALFVYLPGVLLLRGIGISLELSAIMAPIASLAGYIALGIVLFRAGIYANWLSLFAPMFLFGAVVFRVGKKMSTSLDLGLSLGWRPIIAVLVVNMTVACIFLVGLDGPDSFTQGFDAGHHLAQVTSTVQQGNYSTLDVDIFDTGRGAFYPSVLNVMASLLSSCMGCSSALALNAVVYLSIASIYPLGVFLFAHRVFQDLSFSNAAALSSAILSLTFAAMPWELLRYCPLLPNMMGIAILPYASFLFMSCFCCVRGRKTLIACIVLCFIAFGVMGVAHPNAVFSAGLFLFPFCLKMIMDCVNRLVKNRNRRLLAKAFLAAFLIILGIIAWKIVHDMPIMEGIVNYAYHPWNSTKGALFDALILRARHFPANYPLAIMVLLGLFVSLGKKGFRWIAVSYLLFLVLLVVVCSVENGPIRSMLCGFWYCHDFRIMAVFGFACLLPAGIGLGWLSEKNSFAKKALRLALEDETASDSRIARFRFFENKFGMPVETIVVIALCFCVVMFPVGVNEKGELVRLSSAEMLAKISEINDWNGSETTYRSEERAFVKKVKHLVSNKALIMNCAHDGSGYAYGLDELNVVCKTNYSQRFENGPQYILQHRLRDISYDKEVRKLVEEMGVEYVILLDADSQKGDSSMLKSAFRRSEWEGVLGISELTPGFRLVLSEGDMRLYKIEMGDPFVNNGFKRNE